MDIRSKRALLPPNFGKAELLYWPNTLTRSFQLGARPKHHNAYGKVGDGTARSSPYTSRGRDTNNLHLVSAYCHSGFDQITHTQREQMIEDMFMDASAIGKQPAIISTLRTTNPLRYGRP